MMRNISRRIHVNIKMKPAEKKFSSDFVYSIDLKKDKEAYEMNSNNTRKIMNIR